MRGGTTSWAWWRRRGGAIAEKGRGTTDGGVACERSAALPGRAQARGNVSGRGRGEGAGDRLARSEMRRWESGGAWHRRGAGQVEVGEGAEQRRGLAKYVGVARERGGARRWGGATSVGVAMAEGSGERAGQMPERSRDERIGQRAVGAWQLRGAG